MNLSQNEEKDEKIAIDTREVIDLAVFMAKLKKIYNLEEKDEQTIK
jgi:hypothetical protein